MKTMHQFSALKYTIIDEGHLLLSDKLLDAQMIDWRETLVLNLPIKHSNRRRD
jgi:hypothetical protein